KEEGGRHTPFFNNYRPQFYFRTTDVTGQCTLPAGTEMIMPGDNATMDVELITPIAMEEKQRFAIREGGKTVGAGVVGTITDGGKGNGEGRLAPLCHGALTNERPEYPDPAQGVRSPHPRCVDARDRGDRQAHRCAGARPDPAADQDREVYGQPVAAHRQEEP